SYHPSVPLARAGHQFVSAAACVDYCSRVAIVGMQTLITLDACDPYDHVIGSIGGCDPGRASTGLAHAPSEGYGRRNCCCNFVCSDRVGLVVKPEICPLAGVVRDS